MRLKKFSWRSSAVTDAWYLLRIQAKAQPPHLLSCAYARAGVYLERDRNLQTTKIKTPFPPFPGGTGKTPFCAKRAFRGAGVRRRQPQGRRHLPQTPHRYQGGSTSHPPFIRWEVVGGGRMSRRHPNAQGPSPNFQHRDYVTGKGHATFPPKVRLPFPKRSRYLSPKGHATFPQKVTLPTGQRSRYRPGSVPSWFRTLRGDRPLRDPIAISSSVKP